MYNYATLPESLQDGMQRYIDSGIPPGGFLTAVLANDLRQTLVSADRYNLLRLTEIVYWLRDEVPSICWGSREAVNAWVKHGARDFKPIGGRYTTNQPEDTDG